MTSDHCPFGPFTHSNVTWPIIASDTGDLRASELAQEPNQGCPHSLDPGLQHSSLHVILPECMAISKYPLLIRTPVTLD